MSTKSVRQGAEAAGLWTPPPYKSVPRRVATGYGTRVVISLLKHGFKRELCVTLVDGRRVVTNS